MAKQKESNGTKNTGVDLSESSIYGKNADQDSGAGDDAATDATLNRLETLTGGADEPVMADGRLGQQLDELDASTEEELDALRVNLMQDDAVANARDGSGRVTDDIAEERIAKLTEVGPLQPGLGAEALAPGSDDTSAVLRRHHSNTAIADSQAVVEGNLDQPMDEAVEDRKVDEGAAA